MKLDTEQNPSGFQYNGLEATHAFGHMMRAYNPHIKFTYEFNKEDISFLNLNVSYCWVMENGFV